MADTLTRIVGPVNIPSGTNTLFTGTAAHVYTIRHMKIINPTAASVTVKLGIQATAGTLDDDDLILPTVSIDAGGFAEFDGLEILTGTEVIRATASATGMTFSASGLDQG